MTGVLDVAAEPAAAVPASPVMRTAVAIFVSRFPRIEETSILREMNELERQGQPVVLVPLLRDRSKVIHDEARPWLRRAIYMPLVSFRVLISNIEFAFREPRRYFTILRRVVVGTMVHPVVMLKTLALFPKSVHLARVLPTLGIRHIHAQFATHPATMAYIASSLSNMTYSFTVHGPDVFVHRLLLREKITNAKFVRAVSLFNKAFLAGLYSSVAEKKIEVVHVGVNPAVYDPVTNDDDVPAAVSGGRPRLLSVGSLNRTKGFSFVLEACSRLIQQGLNLDYTIVGTGPNAARIAHAIEQLGLSESVHLAGPQTQHEVSRLLRQSDVFVLPSVIANDGHMDGLPIALIEAMAAGKPVIGSAISGIPELIENGVNGLLVDMTHPERIADSLRELLSDADYRARIGDTAKQRVQRNFNLTVTTQKLMALFDREQERHRSVRSMVDAVQWEHLGIVALGMRRVYELPAALLAEVTITDGIRSRDALVKRELDVPGQATTASARSRYEFTALTRVRKALAPDGTDASEAGSVTYGIPRVLLFDEAHAALVLEAPRGQGLNLLIRSMRRRRNGVRRLITPLRRAGAWLAAFQKTSTHDSDGRHILTALVVLALQDLEVASVAERSIRTNRVRIAETLRELEARVAGRPLPVVPQKGNYSPDGVFISDRRVQVINFDGFREGLPLEDAAEFLLHLRLTLAFPQFRGTFAKLAKAFLDGYGATSIDPDALQLFTMIKGLHILASGGARRTGTWRDAFYRGALRGAIIGSLP